MTIEFCFGSDELCKNQKCIISRVGGDGRKYYPCVCDTAESHRDLPAVGSATKEYTTEQLVDLLIEKGYKVTLSRP